LRLYFICRHISPKTLDYTPNDRAFGGQLDVLIDIVSYGVAPAILLLSYGELFTHKGGYTLKRFQLI
jgi:hypothetical protein